MESPFDALRLKTDAARRFKRVDSAIEVIGKMVTAANTRFQRLKAHGLMKEVFLGAQYANGVRVKATVGNATA